MNRRSRVFTIFGIIIVILTLMLALLNIDNWSGVKALALLFALWAEIAFFGGFVLIEKLAERASKIVFGVGCRVIITFYSIIILVVSFIFMFSSNKGAIIFLTIQFVLLAFASILCFVLIAAGKSIKEKSDEVLSSGAQVENCVNALNALKINPSNETYATILGKLAEDLRFTDVSSIVPVDYKIEKLISELEMELIKDTKKKSNEKIDSLCGSLNYLIGRRKMDVNAAKRGGI